MCLPQGLNDDKRAAYESVKAVMSYNGLKGVVVGGFEDAIKNRLVDEFGNESIEEKYSLQEESNS